METNASKQAIAGILSQYHIVYGCKRLHPVAYHTETFSVTQHNWPIYNKELFAILHFLWNYRDWLVGVKVNMCTDYQVLWYFNTRQK